MLDYRLCSKVAKSQNILFGGAQVGTSKLSNLKPINRYGISWLGYALKQNLMRRESLNKLNGYKNRYERLERKVVFEIV